MRVRVAGFIPFKGKVLLVNHRKGDRSYWLLPGGGVSQGESLEEALRRELWEELSLPSDLYEIDDLVMALDSISPERHLLNLVFRVRLLETPEDLVEPDGSWKGFSKDQRVRGAKFVRVEELKELVVHPPIEEELILLLKGDPLPRIYLGRRWRP